MPPMQAQEGPPDHQRYSTDDGFMVADDAGALVPEVDDVIEAEPLTPEESAAIDAEVDKRLASK